MIRIISFAVTLVSINLNAATLTFEENGNMPIGGVSFHENIGEFHAQNLLDLNIQKGIGIMNATDSLNNYSHLVTSEKNVAYLGWDYLYSLSLNTGELFDFQSADFGMSHGNTNNLVLLEGYRDGGLIYSAAVTSNWVDPNGGSLEKNTLNWSGIDRLTITTQHFNSGVSVMDNMVYSVHEVPIPASLPLFTTAILSFLLITKKAKVSQRNAL